MNNLDTNTDKTWQNNISNSFNNQDMDEELLKVFIGNNYEKISTKKFNFSGLFFNSFYFFYRKMFLYGFLLFLINLFLFFIINNFIIYFIVYFIIGIVIGLLINKLYLYFSKKKIAKIKNKYKQISFNRLKEICIIKGRSSISSLFLGLFIELGITLISFGILILLGVIQINFNLFTNKISLNDATISGYSCVNSTCNFSIEKDGKASNYVIYNLKNENLLKELGKYRDYVKINIFYEQKEKENIIVDYKLYLKDTNEDITNIKNEDELRKKIGLYPVGTYTDSFTLVNIESSNVSYTNDGIYYYTNYIFVDKNNKHYTMQYIDTNGGLNLVTDNKYNVTFEVVKGMFEYEYFIKSIN